MMKAVRYGGMLLSWGSLGLLYATILLSHDSPSLLTVTIDFLSYFTVLSNLLVAIAFTWPHRVRPIYRAGIALYITITGMLYFLLLRHAWSPQGIHLLTDILMHYVMPPLYISYWLATRHDAPLRWRYAFWWLAFPLGYAAYTLLHGALTGFYPYYFFNVAKQGLATVLLTMAVMAVGFVLLGLGLIAVDRRFRR